MKFAEIKIYTENLFISYFARFFQMIDNLIDDKII